MNSSFFEKLLWNVYIVDRNKTTFQYEEEVPNLVPEIVPTFVFLLIVEEIIHFAKNGSWNARLNDSMTSVSTGMIMDISKLLTQSAQLVGYQWLYNHRFIDLDWQSPWTWWIAAISVDFIYYWFHRATHEFSLFWAAHQVHHSSEDYNLSTAIRQSCFQYFFSFGFYQPLALIGVPLPAMLVHHQFNLFYQFWIHTEAISNLGPLEWVLNTASHHRVHHGINKWCLDKNYAGFLIIWDRMFGTFEPERKDEKIVYGLVSQPQTFNAIYLQVFYFKNVFEKAFAMKEWSNAFKAIFYGPGWQPGTARLGDPNALPDKTAPRKKFHPEIANWVNYYLVIHFILVVYAQQTLAVQYATFSWYTALTFMAFIFFSIFTIGCTFDGYWWAAVLEAVRCTMTVAILRQTNSMFPLPLLDVLLVSYFALSALIWGSTSITLISSKTIKAWKTKNI